MIAANKENANLNVKLSRKNNSLELMVLDFAALKEEV